MHDSAISEAVDPTPLPVDLARHLGEWFPDLEGNAFAVTDTDEVWTKETAPKLPLCAVGIVEESYEDPAKSNTQETIETTLALLFAFEPQRYETASGKVSPFWAYFDHEALRNRLWAALKAYRSPTGGRVLLRRMDKDSTEIAVTFVFVVSHVDDWCPPASVAAEIEERTLVTRNPRIRVRAMPATTLDCPDCEGQARNCPTCKE